MCVYTFLPANALVQAVVRADGCGEDERGNADNAPHDWREPCRGHGEGRPEVVQDRVHRPHEGEGRLERMTRSMLLRSLYSVYE